MTECANISIERYTDLIIEIEKLKYELEKERIASERRLASLTEYEGKYNELAQNIVEYLIGNNGFLYNWDKERLLGWGLTASEIEAMVSNYENKTSRESNSEENE